MRALVLLALALGWTLGARTSLAAEPDPHDAPAPPKLVVVWPTLTSGGENLGPPAPHRTASLDEAVATRARELDATLRDATQDLGFVLDLADPGPAAGYVRDLDMIARAGRVRDGEARDRGTWVVSARLEPQGTDSFLLRLVVVPPNAKELRTRVEAVKGADVSLRGLVLLRDLLAPDAAARDPRDDEHPCAQAINVGTMATPSRSPGRAVLATNGALFGGFVGYSLVRSTGTSDPRVLYPLLTLGAAVGVGATLLASEEWDVGTGDAWFLSAGAWWGAASGLLIATGTNAQPAAGPYAIGIAGGVGGAALGSFALTRSKMDDGDALLTHSGAAMGMWIGSLVDLGYRGTINITPYTGAGFGSGIGLVTAGTAAMFVTISPSRVLLIDLGAGLGSLAGAAVGSPLIFSDLDGANTTPTKTRIFLASTLAGTAVGGTTAWFLTRDSAPKKVSWLPNGTPSAGVIGQSSTRTGQVPAYGVSYTGTF